MLAPGGEFAFVILGAAAGLVGASEMEAALIIAALTMIAIPFLSKLSDVLARKMKKDKAIAADLQLPGKGRGARHAP